MAFEKDLNHLISTFEYSDYTSACQKKLAKDVKMINKSPNVFVSADKTSNMYEVDPTTYKKTNLKQRLPDIQKM